MYSTTSVNVFVGHLCDGDESANEVKLETKVNDSKNLFSFLTPEVT